jgi:radical SAM protein with 4Fe4S-binding SPASM domain
VSMATKQPRIHSAKKTPLSKLIPLRTPISAHIDICSLCNYRCSFCFQADTEGMKKVGLKRGFMDYDLFKKIVDDLSDFDEPLKKIKIGNHGEPTLHPELPACIEYARSSGCAETIELFTNASKLEPVLNEAIVESGLQRINISLEGLSDERYLEVTGVRQDFREIIAGVKDLYERKTEKRSDLIIYVKVVDEAHSLRGDSELTFTFSDQERAFFYETFERHCDEIFIEKVVPQWAETQLDRQNSVAGTGMYGQAIQNWKDICPFTFMYLHFNCDGTVSPCTLDWPRKVVIGNVKNTSVRAIWEGEKLRDLRLAQVHGKRSSINFCSSCSAPMVCVEEDLDEHRRQVMSAYNFRDDAAALKENAWIDADSVIASA